MSKTDSTRPFLVQTSDTSLPGYAQHSCGRPETCDYTPNGGLADLVAEHGGGPDGRKWAVCRRQLVFWGGIKSGSSPRYARTRRHYKRLDNRERRYAAKRALRRMTDPDDFDLEPVRASRGNSSWYE